MRIHPRLHHRIENITTTPLDLCRGLEVGRCLRVASDREQSRQDEHPDGPELNERDDVLGTTGFFRPSIIDEREHRSSPDRVAAKAVSPN